MSLFRLNARRRGNALLLTLIVTSALAMLAFLAAGLATRTSDRVREGARDARFQNELEAAIEVFRLELVRAYAASNTRVTAWIPTVPLGQRRVYAPYPGVVCWVSRSSGGLPGSQWLELTASTEPATGVRQTVRQLINFDRSSIFDLAILCETTDCMACHLQVRGDWGTLFDGFRPGHDKAGSGFGTQGLGRLYSKGNVVRAAGEAPGGDWINGAEFTGGVEENSTSAKLPVDEDTGEIALPRIQPGAIASGITAEMAATGRSVGLGANASTPVDAATVAEMYALPHYDDADGDDAPDPGEWVSFSRNSTPGLGVGAAAGSPASKALNYRTAEIPPVWDGNLVLIGTEDRPIVLNGDVFVTGDVVIKGVVTGKGAIYAGRNTYVAGDLKYKNPPAAMMDAIRTGSEDPDVAAQADLDAGTDELRLAARANLVLGDYVETSAGQKLPIRDRQASDYMRQQFGFVPTAPDAGQRWFLPFQDGGGTGTSTPSLEVKPDPDNPGMFRPFDWRPQDGGLPIDGALVRQMDGYETLRPRVLETAAGASHDWIGDDSYRSVLGTQQLDLNTYRGFVPRAPATGSTGTTLPGAADLTKRVEILQNELGLPSTQLLGDWRGFARWVDDWYATDPANLAKGVRISFDPTDPGGGGWDTAEYDQPLVTLFKKGVFDETGKLTGYTVRVLDERVQTFPDQTETVDAFLFSNARIAGLTQAGTNLTVNGGMISGEIGILAPGRRAVLDSSMDAWQAGAPSGETGTAGLANENHYGWRSTEGLTTQGVPTPAKPTISPDGLSITGSISAFDGNYSRAKLEIWYQEDATVTPAWTETRDHAATPGSPAWTETRDHPATPGTPDRYYARVYGGTKSVLVGTGYGTEYRTVWDPAANYQSPAFGSAAEAQAWADAELAKPITARASTTAPEETKPRGAAGWGGSNTSSTTPGTPGTPAWTETIDHPEVAAIPAWTETIDHPEVVTAGAWRRDYEGWQTVENYPGASGVVSEADMKAFIEARLVALGKPAAQLSVQFTARDKWKRWGFLDKLNGWNMLDGTTRERDAFLNRWWAGDITLADGRKLNLRTQGGEVNGANGEKFGGGVVNYDFRLRNGGLGYNRIGDDVGKRLVWLPTGYVPPPP